MSGWQGGQTDKGTSDSETAQALFISRGGLWDHFQAGVVPGPKGKKKGTAPHSRSSWGNR